VVQSLQNICQAGDETILSLKEKQVIKKTKEKFPEKFNIIEKLYSPLSTLHYNLRFRFEDDYPAKMPEDFARDMIYLYSEEGNFVWDGCCGSGIVPRMARQLGRATLGTDINPKAIALCKEHDPNYESDYFVRDAREINLPDIGKPHLILSSLPFGLNIIGDKNNYSLEGR